MGYFEAGKPAVSSRSALLAHFPWEEVGGRLRRRNLHEIYSSHAGRLGPGLLRDGSAAAERDLWLFAFSLPRRSLAPIFLLSLARLAAAQSQQTFRWKLVTCFAF